MVLGKQEHVPFEILLLQQMSFLCQLDFMKVMRVLENFGKSGYLRFCWISPDLKQWCLSALTVNMEQKYL